MLRHIAGGGALLHLYFAYKEMFGWEADFVHLAAPSWMREPDAPAHVAWANDLAFKMGAGFAMPAPYRCGRTGHHRWQISAT